MIPVPIELQTSRNEDVLSFLAGTSAHDDVAGELFNATNSLGDVHRFCPDKSQYLYFVVYTDATIFGFATGMNMLGFRLNDEYRSRAIATGARKVPDLNNWVSFELFRSDWPLVDLKFWATRAYVQAREQHEP